MSAAERTLRLVTSGADAGKVHLRTGTLVVHDGSGAIRRLPVSGRVIRIGSSKDNDVVLEDPSVSREHAVIEDHPAGFRLRDLDSTNGTWINGVRVQEFFLSPGVSIKLGSSTLCFEIDSSTWISEAWPHDFYHNLAGRSVPMRHLFSFLDRIAPTDLSVLLLGETGTGKEEIARSLHLASERAKAPFVVFDGATTDATLMGAALFGHTAGAYTGAAGAREGCFQAADGGTLFLDEVGEIPLDLQPKLLRALERREVQPLGSDRMVRVDVRIVAATHRDLRRMAAEGQFRQDLYHRLSGVVLEIPALRQRKEDIPLLAERFLGAANPPRKLGASAYAALLSHDWPGNVRELRNVLQRAATLTRGEVIEAPGLMVGSVKFTSQGAVPADGEPTPVAAPAAGDKPKTLEDREKEAILEALASTSWHLSLTAEILGITRQALGRRLQHFKIEKPPASGRK